MFPAIPSGALIALELVAHADHFPRVFTSITIPMLSVVLSAGAATGGHTVRNVIVGCGGLAVVALVGIIVIAAASGGPSHGPNLPALHPPRVHDVAQVQRAPP